MPDVMVKGYTISAGVKDNRRLEVLFAVTDSGDVYQTSPVIVGPLFHKKGRKWTKASALPDGLEFIGHYEITI